MILLIAGVSAVIVVVAIAVILSRRLRGHGEDGEPAARSHRGRHAARPPVEPTPGDYEEYPEPGDEADTQFWGERPPEIATEPDPGDYLTAPVAVEIPGYQPEPGEGWLPQTLPPEPRPLRAGHAWAEDHILPPPLAAALAAVSFLAGMIAPAARAEAETREREAAERAAAELLRKNMADFPHLFGPDVELGDWDRLTDSGILAAIRDGDEPPAVPATPIRPRRPARRAQKRRAA